MDKPKGMAEVEYTAAKYNTVREVLESCLYWDLDLDEDPEYGGNNPRCGLVRAAKDALTPYHGLTKTRDLIAALGSALGLEVDIKPDSEQVREAVLGTQEHCAPLYGNNETAEAITEVCSDLGLDHLIDPNDLVVKLPTIVKRADPLELRLKNLEDWVRKLNS